MARKLSKGHTKDELSWHKVPARRISLPDGTVLHLQYQEFQGEKWYHFREEVSEVSYTIIPGTDKVNIAFKI